MTQTEQSSGNSAADTWQRVDRAVKAFEDAWQAGQRPAIEDYLGPAGPDRTALLRELVHVDLQRRLAAGERVGVEAYLERFPELAQSSCAVELVLAEYHALAGRAAGAGAGGCHQAALAGASVAGARTGNVDCRSRDGAVGDTATLGEAARLRGKVARSLAPA